MKKIIIYSINLYQKYISPYKGFSCAYGVATGKITCSCYGKKVFERFGVIKGYRLLKRRFKDCAICSNELKKRREEIRKLQSTYSLNNSQRGDIDAGCIEALFDGACDFACDLGCDKAEKETKECFCGSSDNIEVADDEISKKRHVKVLKEIEDHGDYVKFPKAVDPFSETPIEPTDKKSD